MREHGRMEPSRNSGIRGYHPSFRAYAALCPAGGRFAVESARSASAAVASRCSSAWKQAAEAAAVEPKLAALAEGLAGAAPSTSPATSAATVSGAAAVAA